MVDWDRIKKFAVMGAGGNIYTAFVKAQLERLLGAFQLPIVGVTISDVAMLFIADWAIDKVKETWQKDLLAGMAVTAVGTITQPYISQLMAGIPIGATASPASPSGSSSPQRKQVYWYE